MESGSSSPAAAGRTRHRPVVIVADPAWRRRVPGAERIAARAARIADGRPGAEGRPVARATVILASDRAVHRLNARHRGRNRPTNVLSFPGSGEIVLALGVICREAATGGRRPSDHLAHLVVHGTLHLAGHDHHHAGDARRMELTEARLLRRLGFPNPWKRG
jgi:probable rRNA maturation factor